MNADARMTVKQNQSIYKLEVWLEMTIRYCMSQPTYTAQDKAASAYQTVLKQVQFIMDNEGVSLVDLAIDRLGNFTKKSRL